MMDNIENIAGEIWRPVPNFEIFYMASNMGRVYSKRYRKLFSATPDTRGYPQVMLSNGKETKCFKVHMIVWDTFGDRPRDGRVLTVDHIDENKRNNRIDNLQLLTNRENKVKSVGKNGRLPGCWLRWDKKKWIASISVGKKSTHLGCYNSEVEAHKAYLMARKLLAV